MAKIHPRQKEIESLLSEAESERFQIEQHVVQLKQHIVAKVDHIKSSLDIKSKLKSSLIHISQQQSMKLLGGGLLTGLVSSFLFKGKKQPVVEDNFIKKSIKSKLLSLALTSAVTIFKQIYENKLKKVQR